MASLTPGGNFLELLCRGLVSLVMASQLLFKVEGTLDSTNDMFTSLVITGARVSKHCLRRCRQGVQFSSLDGAFKIIFLTSLVLQEIKHVNSHPRMCAQLIKNPLFPTFRRSMHIIHYE
jgi:hypothetical protein